MFEKTVITILKSGAAVAYVFIMLILFSVPVLFVWQAFVPPVFTFDSVSIPDSLDGDENITDAQTNGWYRIDYNMTASSGILSPYSYKIEQFTAEENEILQQFSDYKVTIDAPLEFSNTEDDSFILSLYIKSDTTPDFDEITKTVTFKAVNYEKSFSEFSVTYEKPEEAEETSAA